MRVQQTWHSTLDTGVRVEVVKFLDVNTPANPRVESAYPLPGPEAQFRVIRGPRSMIYTRDLGQVEKFIGARNFAALEKGI